MSLRGDLYGNTVIPSSQTSLHIVESLLILNLAVDTPWKGRWRAMGGGNAMLELAADHYNRSLGDGARGEFGEP